MAHRVLITLVFISAIAMPKRCFIPSEKSLTFSVYLLSV